MAYGVVNEIRKLSGGYSTQTVSDAEITEIIKYSDAVVNLETGKSDWDNLDAHWELVQEASNFIAAARIIYMFGDKLDVADKKYQRGIDMCKQIVALAGGGTGTGGEGGGSPFVIVASQSYKTHPLNPNGDYHRSIKGVGNWPVKLEDVID